MENRFYRLTGAVGIFAPGGVVAGIDLADFDLAELLAEGTIEPWNEAALHAHPEFVRAQAEPPMGGEAVAPARRRRAEPASPSSAPAEGQP